MRGNVHHTYVCIWEFLNVKKSAQKTRAFLYILGTHTPRLPCHYNDTSAMHICSAFLECVAKHAFSMWIVVHLETCRCKCSLIVNDTPFTVSKCVFFHWKSMWHSTTHNILMLPWGILGEWAALCVTHVYAWKMCKKWQNLHFHFMECAWEEVFGEQGWPGGRGEGYRKNTDASKSNRSVSY